MLFVESYDHINTKININMQYAYVLRSKLKIDLVKERFAQLN